MSRGRLRRAAARPGRPGISRGRSGDMPTTSAMNSLEEGLAAPGVGERRELVGQGGVAVALAGWGRAHPRSDDPPRSTTVSRAAPSAQRPPYEWPNTSTSARPVRGNGLAPRLRRPRTRARSRTGACRPTRPDRADRWRTGRARAARRGPSDAERRVVGELRRARGRAAVRPGCPSGTRRSASPSRASTTRHGGRHARRDRSCRRTVDRVATRSGHPAAVPRCSLPSPKATASNPCAS